MKSPNRYRGFTLIELLVVIAIIAIIAAILFPVFAQAKGASKKAAAMSNLSQIGKAVQMYLGDHDDHLPFRFPGLEKWPGFHLMIIIGDDGGTLDKVYTPYIKNRDIWFSPEDRLPKKGSSSFSFNNQLAYAWSMSEIPRPAEAIYMTDRSDVSYFNPVVEESSNLYAWWLFTGAPLEDENGLPGTIVPENVVEQIAPNRYTGKVALYQFLDSHVKAMKFDRTWGDKNTNLHVATKP